MAALRRAASAAGNRVALIETHISVDVLLTGGHAYKIKKAVDLGFLGFGPSTHVAFIATRSLRLNRRLAPSLYLDVVAITGSVDAPVIGGDGPALEYAVKMRAFPQDALLSHLVLHGQLTAPHVDHLAAEIAGGARAHCRRAARRPALGAPEAILEVALGVLRRDRPVDCRPAGTRC